MSEDLNSTIPEELNKVGRYFATHNFEDNKEPTPFSKFEELGWSKRAYIDYLNAIDTLRSVYVLLGQNSDFRPKSEFWLKNETQINMLTEIFSIVCEQFSQFLKNNTGIAMNSSKLDKVLGHLAKRLGESTQLPISDCIAFNFLPYHFTTNKTINGFPPVHYDAYDIMDNFPHMFLDVSLDSFRGNIEKFIARAAKNEDLVTIEFNDSRMKRLYSSREALRSALYLAEQQLDEIEDYYSDNFPEDHTDYSTTSSIIAAAEVDSNRLMLLRETLEEIRNLEDLLDEWETEPWFSSNAGILYVHRGQVKCMRDKHEVKSVTARIPGRSGLPVEMNINYCVPCDKFFINEEEFEFYRKKYGLLAAHFVFESGDGSYSQYHKMAEQSPLKLCGYSVSAVEGYTDEERKGLLAAIINNRIMTKTDILGYLYWFIQYNGSKPENKSAVEKWKSDIAFVRDYKMDAQAHCYVSEVKQWNK